MFYLNSIFKFDYEHLPFWEFISKVFILIYRWDIFQEYLKSDCEGARLFAA